MIPIPFIGFSDPVSSWTHLLAAFSALIAAPLLVYHGRGNATRVTALIVYSFSLIFLFSMSGTFHLLSRGGPARDVLQRLDHAGIWVLIAGTFTPIHAILFRGPMRWAILLAVWTLAITGLTLEVVFFDSFPEWMLLSFFLGLGWIGAISGTHFVRTFRDRSVAVFIAGGLFYSFGALLEFLRWPTPVSGVLGPHEIFHIFVVLGATSHWLFIYHWARHPVQNEITIKVRIYPSKHVSARALGEKLCIEAESVEAFREAVVARVAEKYHATIRPRIHLVYSQEEYL